MNHLNFKMAKATGALLAAAATTCLGFSAPAYAQPATSSLSVSATVTSNCTVSTSPLDFGDVNTLSGSNVDGTGGITVTCTNGTDWEAAAGVGSGSGATLLSRRMTFGSNLLSYSLYTDATRTSVWGDGTGTTSLITNTGTGGAQNVTIYGRIGSGQSSAPAGGYADTVSVTITY